MRKTSVLMIGLVLAWAGFVSADNLTVNAGCALGGTNYGMSVYHDNADTCYVQDNTPASETIYRFTFLFTPGTVTGATKNWRQVIFQALGNNPNPGVGGCPVDPAEPIGSIRVFTFNTGGNGTIPSVQIWGRGNQCGDQGTTRVNLVAGNTYRVCGEWWTGSASTGGVAIAAVGPSEACPAHGSPLYNAWNFTNNLTDVDTVRLGTPQRNLMAANEIVTYCFDEFASFRTLAP